jgi:hypothetical protein
LVLLLILQLEADEPMVELSHLSSHHLHLQHKEDLNKDMKQISVRN